MLAFLAHLHPVLVHLPIGILLLACFFQLIATNKKYTALEPAISISLFWGMLSAIASCISGYLLAQSGDYDDDLVNLHQWFGISVAALAIVTYLRWKNTTNKKMQWLLPSLLLVIITVTGHLGGSLTHGAGYLTSSLDATEENTAEPVAKQIPNVQEAIVYTDIIQPVLQNKCYNCHGPNKQKGKLRMDQPDLLMKGGKDGLVLEPGKPDKSDLLKRILLAREEEHHMPPKEKPQLNEKELALLHWWIETGASFTKKTKEINQTEKIKPLLLSLQHTVSEKKIPLEIPEGKVEPAAAAALKKLRDQGVEIMPVAANNNWLLANYVNANAITDKQLQDLLGISKQLVWIKLNNTKISDAGLSTLSQCTNITKLQLNNTAITDKGLMQLKSLKQLRSLSLVNTKITTAGLLQLKDLSQLHAVYLYQTAIKKEDWVAIQKAFPKTQLDSGGYLVPLLSTDTSLVTVPKIQ